MWQTLKTTLTQRLDLLFFGIFLWTLPFSWGKVLALFPPAGSLGFSEYTDISLYFADLLVLTFVLLYIKEHKLYKLSILRDSVRTLFHVEQFWIALFPLTLLLLAFISYFWSNQRSLNLYASFKLLEMVVLYGYIVFLIVPRGTISDSSTWNTIKYILSIVVISGLFQAIIGILQFFKGSSLGIHFLGESILSLQSAGVAKIVLLGELHLRSYGTFLHPNILGGYLLFSFLSLLFLIKKRLFHVEQWFLWSMAGILLIGILLSFSKSALLALFMVIFFYCSTWNNRVLENSIVPRGTIVQYPFFSYRLKQWIVPSILLALFFFVSLVLQSKFYLLQSLRERADLLPAVFEIIKTNPLNGLGMGQFVYNLPQYRDYESWQLQPIHNIYLLIQTELGVLGIFSFLLFIWFLLKNVPRGTSWGVFSVSLLLSFLFIGFFDHYLWDIEAGQYMLWMVLAFAGGSALMKDIDKTYKE